MPYKIYKFQNKPSNIDYSGFTPDSDFSGFTPDVDERAERRKNIIAPDFGFSLGPKRSQWDVSPPELEKLDIPEINLRDIRRNIRANPPLERIGGEGFDYGQEPIFINKPTNLPPDFDYDELRTPTWGETFKSGALGTIPAIAGGIGGSFLGRVVR